MCKKILVIGSGPIVIGQAAEFDYSGTQGCLALREEGHHVVLVNNNPATIMTDHKIADTIYFEPLTVESLTDIIKHEQPDALLAGLGGQTALNLAVELETSGVLDQFGVELLGTSVRSIQKGEDRELFRESMAEIGQPVVESEVITNVDKALSFAEKVGYPVISRPAYTLGGKGGGIAANETELKQLIQDGLKASPIQQVMLEKSIAGFKEIEYEIMRDQNGTCICVCNMENFDPVGVHTGDSIVIAPSQTLTDKDYQMLRTAAFDIVSELEVIGGCNVQFALDPHTDQYYVIEVNPRVSRSSALASKATGYPIAKMAAKLSLGIPLHELINPLIGHTYASFEPALDYVVVKFPRWPFDKFPQADRTLGTKMKATGEVMAIDRTLEAAFQKAVRSLDTTIPAMDDPTLHLVKATDLRYFALLELLREGSSVEELHDQTKIDRFYLQVLKNIVDMEKKLAGETINHLPDSLLKQAKWFGFSDKSIAKLMNADQQAVKDARNQAELIQGYKYVDTCAAEFSAQTNYVYSTYAGVNEIAPLPAGKKALVIGAGPIRIGQGVEFDYSAVKAIESLKQAGWTTIMLNNNPETVSTDYTTADRLYFEPIEAEVIEGIVKHEGVDLVFTQFGGQTAINLVDELEAKGIPLAGINGKVLAFLEDREKFYQLLDEVAIPHTKSVTCWTIAEAEDKAQELSFPLLYRPSYVIGGQGMGKADDVHELTHALHQAENRHFPMILDEFFSGAELEIDLVADGKEAFIPGIMEHIEPAGIHSGDSMSIFPAVLPAHVEKKIEDYANRIIQHLAYKGLMNIQFLWKNEKLYVLEVNPRASRTVPVVSKVSGCPMVEMATHLLIGEAVRWEQPEITYTAVKFPLFSSHAIPEVDMTLGANMKSTGEGMYLGRTKEEALAKVFAHLPKGAATSYVEGEDHALSFAEWVQTNEAAVYYNDGQKHEDFVKRVQALKYGVTVFSEPSTFDAYCLAAQQPKPVPVTLPNHNRKGVESQ